MRKRKMRSRYQKRPCFPLICAGLFGSDSAGFRPAQVSHLVQNNGPASPVDTGTFSFLFPCSGCTDFPGLRLVINGVPFLGLLGRHGPLALSKLLRLANSRVRHIGCWGRRGVEKNEGRVVVDGGWLLELMCDGLLAAQGGKSEVCGNHEP